VSFNVVSFTEWEVLEAKCKLGVKVLHSLELGSESNTFHCPVVDHTILEDPQAVRYGQKMENNSCGPSGGGIARRDAGQMVVLQTRPFCCYLSKKKVSPANAILCLGSYLYGGS